MATAQTVDPAEAEARRLQAQAAINTNTNNANDETYNRAVAAEPNRDKLYGYNRTITDATKAITAIQKQMALVEKAKTDPLARLQLMMAGNGGPGGNPLANIGNVSMGMGGIAGMHAPQQPDTGYVPTGQGWGAINTIMSGTGKYTTSQAGLNAAANDLATATAARDQLNKDLNPVYATPTVAPAMDPAVARRGNPTRAQAQSGRQSTILSQA